MSEPDKSEALRNIQSLEAAEQRAFERGQVTAKLNATVASHESRLNALNGNLARSATAQSNLAQELHNLKASFEKNIAVTAARAQDAKEAAEKQVSTRTFVFGLIGAVSAIGALLAGTGHA